jgi:hypothetical protein
MSDSQQKSPADILNEALEDIELSTGHFTTTISRPKYADNITTAFDLFPDNGADTAILVAGPMVYEDHFTRDSIRLYRRHYPKALIILSTGEDEDSEYLDDLQAPNVVVLKSRKPENPGIRNREWGRILNHAAVQEAANQQKMYCFRTNTHTRVYAPNLLATFRSLLASFPLDQDCLQRKRLIISSHGSFKYIPFGYSPMLMYGHIDDMLNYWDERVDPGTEVPANDTVPSISLHMKTDISCYFAVRYLQKIGLVFNPESLRDSWRALAEQFCMIDPEMLDLYMHATPKTYKERRTAAYQARNNQMFSFRDWLILYQNRDRIESAPEHILHMPLGAEIPDCNA